MNLTHALLAPAVVLLLGGAVAQGIEVNVDAAALESFVDRAAAAYMQAGPFAGVAFAFVAGEQVVLAKGYGSADEGAAESGADGGAARPVDAETRFRVASLSKPVAATAVLQLVERGVLDLHADVNRYLRGFQIPDDGLGPITLHHLLTHTAGFDDRNVGRATRAGMVAPPLAEYLARAMPARVFAPGEVCSYSNYGFALLGHVVEVASGMPFEQYVAQNVFAPMGMGRSSFAPVRVPQLARGHERGAGGWTVLEDSWDIAGAAANLSATVGDLGRFLLAHLNGGAVDGHRVLAAATLATMHARQFAHHEALAGACYGWFERLQNGWRLLEHSGHWTGYRAWIVLAPEARVGFVLATNTESGAWYFQELVDRFVDTLLPRSGDAPAPRADAPNAVAPGAAAAVAGIYRPTAFARRGLERITSVFATRDVEWVAGAAVRFGGVEFAAREPLLFEPSGADLNWSPGAIAFRPTPGGMFLFVGHDSYERVPWFDTVPWLLAFGGAAALVFAGSVLAWLVVRLRSRGRPAVVRTGGLAAALGAAQLAWLGVLAVAVQDAVGSNGGEFAFGVPAWARALLAVPLVTAVFTALLAWRTARAIGTRRGSVAARLAAAVAVAAHLGWFALLAHWNLLGSGG